MEEFRDIKGYEGLYKVSDLGRVKSLGRWVNCNNGKRLIKDKILTNCPNSRGYYLVVLSCQGVRKPFNIHSLVADAFLDKNTNSLVVDHIDNNKENNKLSNLQFITSRKNLSKDRKNKTSKYTGVFWAKDRSKWVASIRTGKKLKNLGQYDCEIEASNAYKKELNSIICG